MRISYRSLLLTLGAVFVTSLVFMANDVNASDDFCGEQDSQATIHANIPILRTGNLYDFLETQKISRYDGIERFLKETPNIAESTKSSLSDVLSYLYGLNELYGYMAKDSSEGIGNLISERLRGEIDNLYFTQNTQNRRISFKDLVSDDISLSYAAYGTYTFISAKDISITLKIVRLVDGETRTFFGTGEVLEATRQLAFNIFDAFQFPSRQSITNPFEGKAWVGGLSDGLGREMRISDAEAYCKAIGADLPSKTDIMLATNLGVYLTGARVNIQKPYVVKEENIVKTYIPAVGSCSPQSNDKTETAIVLCLKIK